MTGLHRAESPSTRQAVPSSTGKRKRSSLQKDADVTPPKRQSLNSLTDQVITPIRQPKRGSLVNSPSPTSRHETPRNTHAMFSNDHRHTSHGHGGLIDLTSSSPANQSFPRTKLALNKGGPRKLVVKNLRPDTAWDVEKYLEQTWSQLNTTLSKIFSSRLNSYSIDQMYTGVENLCRQAKGATLYSRLKSRCKDHLQNDLRPSITQNTSDDHAEVLLKVVSAWSSWQIQMTEIRRIFYYLDRSYILQNARPSLHDLGVTLFNEYIFKAPSIQAHCSDGICDLIDQHRLGQDIDTDLVRKALTMEHELAVYTESFEYTMLLRSQHYLVKWAQETSASVSLGAYVQRTTILMDREMNMCENLALDASTKRQLLAMLDEHVIHQKVSYLSQPAPIAELLQANDEQGLAGLYELLKRVNQTQALSDPFAAWTENVGTEICFDDTASEDMIVRLLSLKRRLDTIWRLSFQRDDDLAKALRDAFSKFINKTKKTSSTWNTDNSKTGEMIAKYVDLLLKGGVKAISTELMSTKNDNNEQEQQAEVDDGDVDEEKEVGQQLEQVLDLFRFLHGKAVFEAFYKRDLAKRLLLGRSASADAEQAMLGRLKTECGGGFTQNLEQMFKDVELSREELVGYKERLAQINARPGDLDLDVNILSAAAWPTYPDITVKVPENIATALDDFETYYKAKHSGRKLTWKHALANCQINAKFPKGNKQIVVSSFQAIVLLLFNGKGPDEHLTYEQIQAATTLPEAEIKRTLQSLACTKLRPLLKHPQGKEINAGDKFSVNGQFQHPKYRVRINQIQLKETKEENKETHERVAEDRNFECQAAIVRIMKARKHIEHSNLIAEVIKATQSRGVLAVGDIKKNIDRLIEKDYMERDDGNTYNYLA